MLRNRQRLGPGSIKEALDDLDSGICFALPSGRVILINHQMAELAAVLTGGYPQDIRQIKDALESIPEAAGIKRLDTGSELFEFPDGRVWSFETSVLKGPELQDFWRIRALNMTEVYKAGQELENENQALREVNTELQQMLERLSDRIRDRESLELKMRIHNEIGTSLIALSELLESGDTEEAEDQLSRLIDAVGYLGVDTGALSRESVTEQAAALGIKVSIEGSIPAAEPASRIFLAAASECINNCARHAGGSEIYIKVSKGEDCLRFSFSNNGRQPDAPIREGGGLSSLRRLTEEAKGRMTVLSEPGFELIIELPIEA